MGYGFANPASGTGHQDSSLSMFNTILRHQNLYSERKSRLKRDSFYVVALNKAAITRLGLMLADLRSGSGAAGATASVLRTGAS